MRLVQITPSLALDADRIIGMQEISYRADRDQVTSCMVEMADGGRSVRYDVPLSISQILEILNVPKVQNGVPFNPPDRRTTDDPGQTDHHTP